MSKKLDQDRDLLQGYLDGLGASGKSLPGIGTRINTTAVARAAGIDSATVLRSPELRSVLEAAVPMLGIEDQGRPVQLFLTFSPSHPGNPTYRELKTHFPSYFKESGLSELSLPSYQSALNKWMAFFNVHDNDHALPQLGANFLVTSASFERQESPAVCSRLRRWADLYKKLSDSQGDIPETFSQALHYLIDVSGKSRNEISKIVGVSHSSINDWINTNKQPTSQDIVKKLERALGVLPGVLIERYAPVQRRRLDTFRHVPPDWWPPEWQATDQHRSANPPFAAKRRAVLLKISEDAFFKGDEYLKVEFENAVREVQSNATVGGRIRGYGMYSSEKYALPYESWNTILQREWCELHNYKTSDDGFNNIERLGKWKESTAAMHCQNLVYFFGFLSLGTNRENPLMSGKSIDKMELTLAMLSFNSHVTDFLEFKRQRSGEFNSSTQTFIDFVASTLRPESGWLWKKEELQYHLSDELQSLIANRGGWRKHCEASRQTLLSSLKALRRKGSIKYTREPFKPILELLKMDQPLQPVIKGLKLHRRDLILMERSRGKVDPLIAAEWRNHLLVSFLIRFPLRAKHWCAMTYRPDDNTGNLRRNSQGWELVLPYTDFKNNSNSGIFDRRGDGLLRLDFSTPQYALLHQLSKILDDYVKIYWPLLKGDSDILFPNSASGEMTVTLLNTYIRKWTGEYVASTSTRRYGVAGVAPFGTHAFRDLVATGLVKNASIDDAAAALLDSRKMVEDHYARFIPEDRLKNAFTSLEPAFEGHADAL